MLRAVDWIACCDRSATGEKALTLARERRAAKTMRILKIVDNNWISVALA